MHQIRKAYFGDVHGYIDGLEQLYSMLGNYSLDAVEHCGDLVDRGPDPAGCVEFCRKNNLKGVMGNHESVLIQYPKKGTAPLNPDKRRSMEELNRDPANWEYLNALPYYKIQPEGLLHCHSGINPLLTADQLITDEVSWCTVQQVHPDHPGKTKWFTVDKKGIAEDTHRAAGWKRWYELYDGQYSVVAGHTVFSHDFAHVHPFPNGNAYFAIDTGGWFTKNLTALIWPDRIFVSTKHGEYRL